MDNIMRKIKEIARKLKYLEEKYTELNSKENQEIQAMKEQIHLKYTNYYKQIEEQREKLMLEKDKYTNMINNEIYFNIYEFSDVIKDILSIYECRNYELKVVEFIDGTAVIKKIYILIDSTISVNRSYDYNKYDMFKEQSEELKTIIFENVNNDKFKLYEQENGNLRYNVLCDSLPYLQELIEIIINKEICSISCLQDEVNDYLISKFDEISNYGKKGTKRYNYKL